MKKDLPTGADCIVCPKHCFQCPVPLIPERTHQRYFFCKNEEDEYLRLYQQQNPLFLRHCQLLKKKIHLTMYKFTARHNILARALGSCPLENYQLTG